jgi:hypothetical protein
MIAERPRLGLCNEMIIPRLGGHVGLVGHALLGLLGG